MTAARQPPSDPAAVHRGLLAIARERKADFNAILAQYAIERLIDRLSRSPESPRFVLKGAMLFRVWTGELHRPTKDVDFLGHGDPSPAVVADAVRTIVSVKSDDGLRFALETISASGAFDSRHRGRRRATAGRTPTGHSLAVLVARPAGPRITESRSSAMGGRAQDQRRCSSG